mgnify:CR=1 FL=1
MAEKVLLTDTFEQTSLIFGNFDVNINPFVSEAYASKKWAEMCDCDIHFVTIDSYIPQDWLL